MSQATQNPPAQSPQQAQHAQLLDELVTKLEKQNVSFAELTKNQQENFKKHSDDIGKLSDEIAELGKRGRRDQLFGQHGSRGPGGERVAFDSPEVAADFGRFFASKGDPQNAALHLAGMSDRGKAANFTAAFDGTTGEKGGFAVVEQFMPELIRNVEQYGVIDVEANRPPFTSLIAQRIKRTGGITMTRPDVGGAGTDSVPKIGKIKYGATRGAGLSLIDRWMLKTEAYIDIANLVMEELGQSLGYFTDNDGFNGDGTSTYGGILGLLNRSSDTGALVVNGDSGDDTIAEMVAKHVYYLGQCIGLLPQWADNGNAKWYMHRDIFWRLLSVRDSQGMPIANILANAAKPSFTLMSYPVVMVQVCPKQANTAVSKVFALFGNLKKSHDLARFRNEIEIRTSDELKFSEGLRAVQLDVMQDQVVTDVTGFVALKTAAS